MIDGSPLSLAGPVGVWMRLVTQFGQQTETLTVDEEVCALVEV